MERGRSLEEERLAKRVAVAPASHQERRIEELDRLLTDCAARALRVQTELLRIERFRETMAVADSRAEALRARENELEAEQRHLSELLAGLRDLRERLAHSEAA